MGDYYSKKEVITMKKRMITAFLMFALLVLGAPGQAFADDDPLLSNATYHTEESDYIPGDCVLTATKMMIKRAAIMNGQSEWGDITNELLRPTATYEDGCLISDFRFVDEGLSYRVRYAEFSGSSDGERIEEFRQLLKEHPEGIVVHGEGAAETGTHGVLVVGVDGYQVYAVDATYNKGDFNKGIQKWQDTTMLDPLMVTQYWYIDEIVRTEPETKIKPIKELYFNILRRA